jgi:integrase
MKALGHVTVHWWRRRESVICTTPAYSPESNGMAECFVKGFKRDYVYVNAHVPVSTFERRHLRFAPRHGGVTLKAVQEMLGHATIEMTMRYAHLSPDVSKEAVRLLDRAPSSSGDAGRVTSETSETDRVTVGSRSGEK